MDNVFLDLLYSKEFNNRGIVNRIKNHLEYRSFIRKLKKEGSSFDMMWQYAQFLRWADLIYGFKEDVNQDVDLIKKRNPYYLDQITGEDLEITFTINVDERSRIVFNLVKKNKVINIEVSRSKIRISEDKTSSISFHADKESYEFSKFDILMICEINRTLQNHMIKYTKMFYERIK